GLVYGLSQIGAVAQQGTGGDGALGALLIALGIGAVGLALFFWRQVRLQKEDDALLDLRVFRSRNFSLSVAQLALMSLAFFGALNVLPLYMQRVLELPPLEAGLAMLPGSVVMGVLGPIIGRIYDARGTQILLVPGAVIVIGMLWFYTTF